MTESPSAGELAAALEECSKKGGRIGIATGTFGLIHAGTVRFLRAARAECDHLFVAIFSEPAGDDGSGDPPSRIETAARHLMKPGERRRVLTAIEGVEVADFAGQDGLSLSEWVRLAPSARWMASDSEGDVGAGCEAQLRQAGVTIQMIHEGDSCTTRALLRRMGASGRERGG